MWQVVGLVSSWFAVVAFVVAALLTAYQYKLYRDRRIIESGPPEKRILHVQTVLNRFSVPTEDLTKDQRFELALRLLRERSVRFKITIFSFVGLLVVAMVLTFVVWPETRPKESPENGLGALSGVLSRAQLPVATVSTFSVHVSDTWADPQDKIEIGAIDGPMTLTDSEGKAKLRLEHAAEAWDRIQVQLGQASCDEWDIVSPFDHHVRIPDSETECARIVLLKKGCENCLGSEVVGRIAARTILDPNAESGVEELAMRWEVSPAAVRASIEKLIDSTDPLDQVYYLALYDENTTESLDQLQAARTTRIMEIEDAQSFATFRERLEAMDELVTVDAWLVAARNGTVFYRPEAMDAARAAYADAYRKSIDGGAGLEEWRIIAAGDPEQLSEFWAATVDVKPPAEIKN